MGLPLPLSRSIDRDARVALSVGTALLGLREDLLKALIADPGTIVRTPAYGSQRNMEARGVFLDHIEGRPAALDALIQMVIDCAHGQRCETRASKWLDDMAAAYAELHADEIAAEDWSESDR